MKTIGRSGYYHDRRSLFGRSLSKWRGSLIRTQGRSLLLGAILCLRILIVIRQKDQRRTLFVALARG
jgi:hypothetical protein